MAIQKITNVNGIDITANKWYMVYINSTNDVMIGPKQGICTIQSPHILVIADTEEELLSYIDDNDLVITVDDDDM